MELTGHNIQSRLTTDEPDPQPDDAEQNAGARDAQTAMPVWMSYLALVYLVMISAAEVLANLVNPHAGIVLYGFVLVAFLVHSAASWRYPIHRLLLTLAFAPLIRLLSMSLPLARFPLLYWYLITSVPLYAAAVVITRVLKMDRRELGFVWGKPLTQLGIGLTGLAFGVIEYLILRPEPLVESLSLGSVWLPALILVVSTGLAEELIFRAIMQRAAIGALGASGIVYVAGLFAVLHLGYKSLADFVFVFIVALFFGWAMQRTRSIVGITIAHGLTNVLLFLVMPFLV
ncbi:MAG: CPBP family intramembrane metalloprotease [Anaerolineales bacterium]|nr:CPBP family intramembrane metalloprotease [Anaerolineales bacterium]